MTAAARDLAVSQPAISKHLRNLEAHVGARLLERSARLVRPTPQGQKLYETSQPALSAIDAAIEGARTNGIEVEGRLRLHAPSCIGAKHLHPIVTQFQALHSRVTVDLVLEERIVDLVHEDYDLALRIGRPEGRDLVVRRLGWSRRILAAAPAYLERVGTIDAPEQLSGLDFVAIASAAVAGDVLALQRGGETVNVPVRPVLRTNSAEVLVSALRTGRAMAPVQHLLVAEDLATGRLVRVLSDYAIRSTEVFLIFPSVRHMRPAVRAFTDFAVPRLRAVEGMSRTA